MNSNEQMQRDYVAPLVEWLEMCVEAGFGASFESTGNESYGSEAGSWETVE